jgi:hypothetical protein
MSGAFEQELRSALKRRDLPIGLSDALNVALDKHAAAPKYATGTRQRQDVVALLLRKGKDLQTAMKRADVVFSHRGRRFLSSKWSELSDPLSGMMVSLKKWLVWQQGMTSRKRGNPHLGERTLRLDVFGALDEAGIRISKDAGGRVAAVMRLMLAEADRRAGRSLRARSTFNGTQWARWVAEYKFFHKAATIAVEDGEAAAVKWIETHRMWMPTHRASRI